MNFFQAKTVAQKRRGGIRPTFFEGEQGKGLYPGVY